MGQLIQATKDAGIYEETDFVMISDHGQMNIVRAVAMNAVLAENGLIDVNEKGEIVDWTAMIKSTGASAQVYLKNPECPKAYEKTYEVLKSLVEDGVYGIERVYTAEEVMKEEGLGGKFSFVIETDGYTSFSNDWRRPWVRNIDITDYKFGHGTHGYQPDKGPQPTLVAFGPDIKPGVVIERRPIVDEAPTFAKALGIDMTGADGRCLTELFSD